MVRVRFVSAYFRPVEEDGLSRLSRPGLPRLHGNQTRLGGLRPERGIWGIARCRGKSGAPGENRIPNLLVRSQALYPIELRAHCGEIASLNYSGNRIASPNPIAFSIAVLVLDHAMAPPVMRDKRSIAPCACIFEYLQFCVKLSPHAQNLPARAFYQMHVGNALAMASDMLSVGRRSGAQRGIWENTSARGLSECPFAKLRLFL